MIREECFFKYVFFCFVFQSAPLHLSFSSSAMLATFCFQKWNGSFYNCILAAEGSAAKLLNIIVENFESFRDFAEFCGQKGTFLYFHLVDVFLE